MTKNKNFWSIGTVKVAPDKETMWLKVEEMVKLFDRDRSVIQRHIRNIFKENELEENSTCAKFAQVQNEGNKPIERTFNYYNLDMIISVRYRVKSPRGIAFRKWAASILKEYIVQGYVVNAKRLNVLNKVVEIQSNIIVASIFLYFLNKNNLLFKNDKKIISDSTLVAITLLLAESRPEEKEIMINVIMNFLEW